MKKIRSIFGILAVSGALSACAPVMMPQGGYYAGRGYYDFPPHPLDQRSAVIEWNNAAVNRNIWAHRGTIGTYYNGADILNDVAATKRHWDWSIRNLKRAVWGR